MHLIEVAFKGNRREFFHWQGDDPPALRAPVIVEADRGEDLGVVHSTGELAERRHAGVSHDAAAGAVSRTALRLATPAEYDHEHRLRHEDDEAARRQAMTRVREHGLAMKVSDAEWQWDGRKLTLYFTAERRVDFRALVRDLAATFRARIELKQIGVRDEARRLDGVGRCGRQYCSASFLTELRPVNLGVAKDQGLSLNPLQISGACGRLMCCLRFEHDFYVQSRKRFPKEGRIIVAARGEEKVVANDIFNDRVTLRNVEGDVRVVPLDELRQEIAATNGSHVAPPAAVDASADTETVAERQMSSGGHGATGGGSLDTRRRARRTLPVRDSAAAPRSSRPGSGHPRDASQAGVHVDAHVDSTMRVEREEERELPSIEHASTHADELLDAGADDPRDAEDDAAGDDGGTEDQRRKRRRGRRGGRRGRAARDDSSQLGQHQDDEQGNATGASAPGTTTDDRGD